MKLVAKKSLGQNFIHAPWVINGMVDTVKKDGGVEKILEVGPGTGTLTKALLDTGATVVAVEKDDRAIPLLKEKFSSEISSGKLKLVHGDILEILDGDVENILNISEGEYSFVANIPYYLTGELLRKLLSGKIQPKSMVVMVQKEVAKRIVANDGKESILSISVKVYGNPSILCSVPRRFFKPVPSVDSAVLVIDHITKGFFKGNNVSENDFFTIVKAGFAHKRKVLRRNLLEISENVEEDGNDIKKLWEKEGWSEGIRAESFKIDDWLKVCRVFHIKRP